MVTCRGGEIGSRGVGECQLGGALRGNQVFCKRDGKALISLSSAGKHNSIRQRDRSLGNSRIIRPGHLGDFLGFGHPLGCTGIAPLVFGNIIRNDRPLGQSALGNGQGHGPGNGEGIAIHCPLPRSLSDLAGTGNCNVCGFWNLLAIHGELCLIMNDPVAPLLEMICGVGDDVLIGVDRGFSNGIEDDFGYISIFILLDCDFSIRNAGIVLVHNTDLVSLQCTQHFIREFCSGDVLMVVVDRNRPVDFLVIGVVITAGLGNVRIFELNCFFCGNRQSHDSLTRSKEGSIGHRRNRRTTLSCWGIR